MNKICIKCNKLLDINFFHFRNKEQKYRNTCKNCSKKSSKERYLNNLEDCKRKQKIYLQNNKEKIILYKKEYYKKNKERISQKTKEHQSSVEYKTNKNLRRRLQRDNDPAVRLRHYIGVEINTVLKQNKSNKNGRSFLKAINYSLEELKNHLESKFEFWMTWENQGKYIPSEWDDNDSSTWKWQLDHIIPQSLLSYTSMEEDNFKKCWALSNLRPYSAKQNILDGNRR